MELEVHGDVPLSEATLIFKTKFMVGKQFGKVDEYSFITESKECAFQYAMSYIDLETLVKGHNSEAGALWITRQLGFQCEKYITDKENSNVKG